MGVVYYANYLVYFERGRTELLRQSGLPYNELEESGFLLPVIESHCEYLKPAVYDDELIIISRIQSAKGVRIHITCEVYRKEVLLARGYTCHACTDTNGKPCRLPESIKRLVASG